MATAADLPLFCEICQVSLSGRKPAEQHYNSIGHKRKEENSRFAKKSALYCHVCNIACNTFGQLEEHKQSPRHQAFEQKQKVAAHRPSLSGDTGSGTTENSQGYVFNGSRGYCFLCKIDLTSSSHAQSHLTGSKHLKRKTQMEISQKVGLVSTREQCADIERVVGSGIMESKDMEHNGANYYKFCELCQVPFSGHENAKQHYSSEKHRKKEHLLEMEEKGELLPLRCDVCDSSFTGHESAKAHFDSQKHKRNEANKKIQTGTLSHGEKQLHVSSERETVNANALQIQTIQYLTKAKKPAEIEGSAKSIPSERFNNGADANLKPANLSSYREDEEKKIQNEMSDSGKDKSLSSLISSLDVTDDDSFSKSNEPVRFIRNDLGPVKPAFGRGKTYMELKNSNALVGQLLSKGKEQSRGLPSDLLGKHGEESELKQISVKSGDTAFKLRIDQTKQNKDYDIGFSQSGGTVHSIVNHNKNCEPQVYAMQNPANLNNYKVNMTDLEKKQALLNQSLPQTTLVEQQLVKKQSSPETEQQNGVKADEFFFDAMTKSGRCYVCNIDLTSVNHMTQHIYGKKHKKSALVWYQSQSGAFAGLLACSLCNVSFPGPEVHSQHNQSEAHLQREKQARSQVPSCYCEICKIACSGEVCFQQHLAGAQHKKNAGLSGCSGNIGLVAAADRTVWHQCDICGCSVNSLEQLAIHRKSHAPAAQTLAAGTSLELHEDKTTWYPCHVCNCRLNSLAQFQIHEQSPSHLIKLKKPDEHNFHFTQPPEIESNASNLCTSGSLDSSWRGSVNPTPLESFLSLELFPEEFLPKMEPNKAGDSATKLSLSEDARSVSAVNRPVGLPAQQIPFKLVVSDSPLPFQERFASGEEKTTESLETLGSGGARRGQGSDIAWATRNKGSGNYKRDSLDAGGDSARDCQPPTGNETNDHKPSIVVGQQESSQGGVFNPYAATHKFYCHTCKAPMNTQSSYEDHIRGKRHLQKVCTEPAPEREHSAQFPLPRDYSLKVESSPRNYQLELYNKAMNQDTLCFLPTGTGKTLVSVLVISAMLEKYPTRNVLFLVDKVLLVLQQSQYIKRELQDKKFIRYNPDSPDMELETRQVRVAAMCMGQQNTSGVPLWKHDIVVATAAFCQNLLLKGILRWKDFSLVVLDEAHHCDKAHPFNTLLQQYHVPISPQLHRPKVIGLTASPAGKADVPKTVQMLENLIANMGGVAMSVVEDPENVRTLREFQSNAKMIIKSHSENDVFDDQTVNLRHKLNLYILNCYKKLCEVSDIQNFINPKVVLKGASPSEVCHLASQFVDENLDVLQSSLMCLCSNEMKKVEFRLLTEHVAGVCRTLNSLLEGGVLALLEEIIELQGTHSSFDFARTLGLPCDDLYNLIHSQGLDKEQSGSPAGRSCEQRTVQLLDILMDRSYCNMDRARNISLVLVKERGTAHRLTKTLQNNSELKALGLNTTSVVGHGGSGAAEKGMSVNQQKRVLEEIKQFKYQIIIATSVAEEGVDWPECERVICMYPPSTVTALVQMRGRARKKNSLFIVLCASEQEEEKLLDIMNREQNMIEATQILVDRAKQAARV